MAKRFSTRKVDKKKRNEAQSRRRQNSPKKNFPTDKKPTGPNNYSRKRTYKKHQISHKMYIHKATNIAHDQKNLKDVTFSDFSLIEHIQNNLRKQDFVHPTEIQAKCIPEILAGNDVVGLASTGSGKTAAFLLPLISKIYKSKSSAKASNALIVAPTRELASQIQNEFYKFGQGMGLLDVLLVGGTKFGVQVKRLKMSPQFVIATPGRLLDLYEQRHIMLKDFDHIVLDEVDQMLDMGFFADIQRIISKLNSERQSLFFSATLNDKARELATTLLNEPVEITLTEQKAVSNVEQDIVHFGDFSNKITALHKLLINIDYTKVLIFVKTKQRADSVAEQLNKLGHSALALHGDKMHGTRMLTLRKFKSAENDILVATDVAARGLDIPEISHVINYDEPDTYQDYVHRIGRTGRIGRKGYAYTFVA